MKDYKLLIAAEYTLLLEKGIPTNWYFDTFTNKIYDTSGAEYSYSEHVFPIIGSTLKTHNVALLNQENITIKLREKKLSEMIDTAKKRYPIFIGTNPDINTPQGYKEVVEHRSTNDTNYAKQLGFIDGCLFYKLEQSGNNDQQLEAAFEAGIGWQQFCSEEDSSSISRFELFKRYLKSIQKPVMYDVEIDMYDKTLAPPADVYSETVNTIKFTEQGEILITKIL